MRVDQALGWNEQKRRPNIPLPVAEAWQEFIALIMRSSIVVGQQRRLIRAIIACSLVGVRGSWRVLETLPD